MLSLSHLLLHIFTDTYFKTQNDICKTNKAKMHASNLCVDYLYLAEKVRQAQISYYLFPSLLQINIVVLGCQSGIVLCSTYI